MQRGIAQRECTALADTEQVDRIQPMTFAHHVDATIKVAVDVIVQRQPAIRTIGIAPVDQIDILALLQQVAHHRAIGLQVGHPHGVDQCIDDQQRCLRGGFAVALEVPYLQLVFAVHQLARSIRIFWLAHAAQVAHAGRKLALERGDVAQSLGRIDTQWCVHGNVSLLALARADMRDGLGARPGCRSGLFYGDFLDSNLPGNRFLGNGFARRYGRSFRNGLLYG